MKEMPPEILELFRLHHTEKYNCELCTNSCCFQSGFAVMDNVREIYQVYLAGKLVREGYTFVPNLDFANFVRIYFDVVPFNGITAYFPKHIAHEDNLPLHITPQPGTNYYEYRKQILSHPLEDCKGCVFLESSMSYHDRRARRCILHDESNEGMNYAKPIDCRFLTCSSNRIVKNATEQVEGEYFRLLRKYYGD